jgi:lipid II:glycine glycyltransferase (peptidoglycan interpeptide bridge formation enzyme)
VRLLWTDAHGEPLAGAQVLHRRLGRTPGQMLYVPKGPCWDYHQPHLTARILADLEAYAADNQALFIKIDPDVVLGYEPEAPPAEAGQAVKRLLHQRGWRDSAQQIQFRNTVTLDLQPDEETLLADMKSKWRYNIRLAERRGVEIFNGGQAELGEFYRLYAITSQRDGFLIRPESYYLDAWQTFLQAGQAELLLARVNGELVAGLMLFIFKQTAWYMYGASSNEHRRAMPNHLLQWRAIQQAQSRGCTLYDMWGAPDDFSEDDPMWGVYRFKQGFNGQTRQGLGAWDFPVWPTAYSLYQQALPQVLSLWRWVVDKRTSNVET